MADQVRHDELEYQAAMTFVTSFTITFNYGPSGAKKRKTGSENETGFSLSYEGLEPSTHALKGRCSTN